MMAEAGAQWRGRVSGELVRPSGDDQEEIISYESGAFTRRLRSLHGASPMFVQLLQGDVLEALRTTLSAEVNAAPEGIDPLPLEVILKLLDDAIRNESTR